MLQQTLAEVSEISVRVAFGGDSLVHLNHMNSVPGHIFLREIAKHDPGSFAAAHCHHEFASSCDCLSGLFRDQPRGFTGDRSGIRINFNFHQAASLATANPFLSPTWYQSPGGVTRLTSSGPQVFGAYGYAGVFCFNTGSTMRHASST